MALGGKSPGVKILWLWTFGTAGVLVTFVARKRITDMERILNEEEAAARMASSSQVGTTASDDQSS